MGKNRVLYFYDEEIGNYYYGAGHPMKPHRVRMTHDLVLAYDMIKDLDVLVPNYPNVDDLTRFHANDYIDFLRAVTPENVRDFGDQMHRFNVGDDCPVFDGLWDFCSIYSGGTIGGAQKLMTSNYDIAVNWAGGLHHGKKHEASGFCYVNDCVLGALEFLKYQFRVLYVDIDIHHGDGVEEAFYSTPRVMCCSFHKYGDYFPGTGAINDIGIKDGIGYSVNVPLKDGIDDETFIQLFEKVMTVVMEYYKPQTIVMQCGADSLSGDRLGCFNLSLKGHGHAVKFLAAYRVPMLVLGGGGYTLRNVPRCWAYETGILLGKELEEEVPEKAEFYGYYGPDYKLNFRTSNMENKNEAAYLEEVIRKVTENCRYYVSPICTGISADSPPPLSMETCHLRREEEFGEEETADEDDSSVYYYSGSKLRPAA